jgi:hypothetical protein
VGTISGSCTGRTFTVTADGNQAVDEYSETNNAWTGTA